MNINKKRKGMNKKHQDQNKALKPKKQVLQMKQVRFINYIWAITTYKCDNIQNLIFKYLNKNILEFHESELKRNFRF